MLAIPENILARFNEVLQQRAVHESFHVHYRKRLGSFLDFCRKYPPPEARSDQVRLFIGKLKSKKQTPQQFTQSHIISLLYGCGLRLFECLSLRVQNFNFEDGILTVPGKGDKDRTVPLPQTLIPKLKTQLEVVSELHEKDLVAGRAGVFLVDSLEKKYPAAVKDFIRQWFFPQKRMTPIPGTKEHRRYHLHESQVQEALKKAVRIAKCTKRVKIAHFSARFATQLLQANYDIRTIQTLLDHTDVRTTMIYIYCIPSKTAKEAKSPLDF